MKSSKAVQNKNYVLVLQQLAMSFANDCPWLWKNELVWSINNSSIIHNLYQIMISFLRGKKFLKLFENLSWQIS